jgi:hypothetical protein
MAKAKKKKKAKVRARKQVKGGAIRRTSDPCEGGEVTRRP